MMQAVRLARVSDQIGDSLSASLGPVEYGYYIVLFYTVLGPALGLILAGGIGSGFLMIPVVGLCFIALGPASLKVLQTALIPLACGASYLFIQLALHDESTYAMYVYQFGPWLFSLIIVQALCKYRPDFLHRFAWFTLLIGLAMLPYMSFGQAGGYERVGLDRSVAYANPNALAGYFGFCFLYLVVKGYIESRMAYRLAAWLMAAVALFLVTLTVSRGALVAVAVSLLVASRKLLKVGVLPLLLLTGFLLGIMATGVFDQAIDAYTRRAGEETGRLKIWPLALEKFLNSPMIGVGASRAGVWTSPDKYQTPHNSFLLFAVASGVIPLALFCAYCFRSGMAALRANMANRDSAFHLPLVTYTVLVTSAGNMDFMAPWAVVSLAMPLAAVSRAESEREGQHGF